MNRLSLTGNEVDTFQLPGAKISCLPEFYSEALANQYFQVLYRSINWSSEKIRLFGKVHNVPRLSAFYGDGGISYCYSGIHADAMAWIPELAKIREDVERAIGQRFNSVLANLYRDGNDSNGWHADDEKSLGVRPVIASLSLGAARDFQIKHRRLDEHRYSLSLTNGSLLLMAGDMQTNWLHQIPKRKSLSLPRINLTFRFIYHS